MTVPLQSTLALRDLVFTLAVLPILLIWLVVNAYIYYPVCRAVFKRHWWNLRRVWQKRIRKNGDAAIDESVYGVSLGGGSYESLSDDSLPTMAVLLAQWMYIGLSEGAPGIGTRIRRSLTVSTALALPWGAIILGQWYAGTAFTDPLAYGWLTALSLTQIRTTILTLAGYPDVYPLLSGNILTWIVASAVSTIFAITSIFAVFTFRDDGGFQFAIVDEAQAAALSSLLFVSLAVPFIFSLGHASVFIPQFTFLSTIPLYLLVARGVANIEQRHVQTGLVVAPLLAATVFGAFYIDSSSQENWRSPTQQLERGADSDDIVIFQPEAASVGFQH